MVSGGRTLKVTLLGDNSGLSRMLSGAAGDVSEFQNRLNRTGRNVAQTGASLTAALTAPIVAIGGGAVLSAMKFESAFTGVVKTVEASDETLAGLRQGIIDMSKEIPASANEIAAVGEIAGQLGIDPSNLLDFTRIMIDLGETTNLEATEAASSLSKFANIVQMGEGDFDRLGSTIVALGNQVETTEADIVSLGMNLAGAMTRVGFSEDQIMSWAAALSSVDIQAEKGGSAMSRVVIDIAQSVDTADEKLATFAEVAGMSVQEFSDLFERDASSAVLAFIEGLNKVEDSGHSVFTILEELDHDGIRVRDTLLRVSGAGEKVSRALGIGAKGWAENSALAREAALRYETFESKLQIFKNQVIAALIVLGDSLLPILSDLIDVSEPLIDAFASLAEWFGKLPKDVKLFTVVVAGLLAVLGPLLVVLGGAAIAIAAISTPVLIVIGVLAALAIGIAAVIIFWDDITAAFWRVVGVVRDAVAPAFEFIGGVIDRIPDRFSPLLLLLGPAGVLALAWKFRDEIMAAFAWVRDNIGAIIDAIVTTIQRIPEAIQAAIDKVIELPGAVRQATADAVGDVPVAGGALQAAGSAIPLSPEAALLGPGGAVGKTLGEWARDKVEDLWPFDNGGIVPGPIGAPRMIMAHGGETVLPTHRGGAYDPMAGSINVVVNIHGELHTQSDVEDAIVAAIHRARARGEDV